MSKSLQKCILFAVCIALVCALGVTLFIFDGTGGAVTGQEGQASNVAQNTATYTHGSNSGRAASGTKVTNASGFITALRNNETINLQNDIILASSDAFPRSANGYLLSYSSTIYGNGYTISFTGRHSEGSGEWANPTNSSGTVIDWKQTVNYYGGIVGQLAEGGHIYDLNVVMTSGNIAFKSNDEDIGDTWLDVGGIAGIVESGASIENCTFTISQENSRLASLKWPETTMWQPAEQWGRAGGIAGELNGGSIINCTVTNNGSIEAGDSGRNDYVTGNTYRSAVGNIVGWIGSGTIQNVRVSGSGSLNAFKVGNIGVLKSGSTISTQNFYNNFSGTFNVLNSTNGGSSSSAYDAQNGSKSATITNMFTENNATSGSVTGTVNTINNTSNIPSSRNYSVYFDPKQGTNYGNSLAVVFNQTPSASMKYTLVAVNGTKYDNDKTISNAIVFRNLPTAAATWNSGGNFTAELKSESVGPQHPQQALQPYEHGYTTGTPSGTPINSGSEFQGLFSRTGTIEAGDTGTYYLTDDIVITGFTGKQFAGTLDGNGHTIYIAASDTSLAGHTLTSYNGNAVGGVIGALSGTIKNVRVVIDANITVGLNANLRGRVGGVVGRLLNGGSIENVQVIIPGDITLSYTNAGVNDVSMGAVVGQATGASTISGLTVQMDGTLAPVGSYVWVSAVVGEIQAKSDHADTVSMNNIIVRGTGTFAAEAEQGTDSGEPPYVSALATFNNNGENYPLVNLDGLIYDFVPTFSADGSAMYGLFVNNDSDGNTANYDNYVADSNLFIMQGREYTPTKTGTQHAGNTYIPLDGAFKTINTSVTGVDGATVAAYFMPGTGLVRLQVHSDSWGDERLTISGVEVDSKPIMSSLTTAGDSSSDRYFSVDKSTLSGLGDAVQVSLFSNVTDPTVQGLTYTGSPLDIVIDMNYNGAPLTAGDYSLSDLKASSDNALVQDGKPLNAGEYSVTVTLSNPDHWFGIDGSGEASKTANVTFTVSPKNVTMQDPGDSRTAVYGEKYWILSNNNVWGLDENLFFDEVVGNVEYTATVTREDDGEGYASASGWLKAGSYTVTLTINDSNYAINGDPSVTYPLTITPVGLSYTLTVENSVAAVYDGNVRTISGTPQGGDGIISAAHEGSAGTAGDSVTAAVSVTYGGVTAPIQNAGDYVLGVALSGDDAENYTAVLTASWTDGGAIANNTVTVEKYPFTLQWGFDSQVALEYGDDITDDLIAETELFEAAAIPYNGGSFTGKISFNVVSAVYNDGTAYAPGVAAGTNVTFTVAPVLPDVLDANNYDITLRVSGSDIKTVGQRTLTVNYDAFDMTAVYGASISNEWLTEQYKEEIAANVSNIYNNEEVNFKVILYYRTFGGAYQEISDFSELEPGETYMAAVVVDGNDNYTIPNALTNGFDFTLNARELTVSGITWAEEGFDGIYDGKEHALKVVLAEGSSIKEGDEGVLELSVNSLTDVNDGGAITVTVAGKYADKYTLTGDVSFTVTLEEKTLTVSPFAADFLDYGLTALYEYLTSADSGLVTGVAEGDTLAISGSWAASPAEVELGGEKYVAEGNYTLNISVTDSNYKFDDNAMSVTVNALDISGAEVAVTWNESDLTYTAQEQSVTLASVTVNGADMPVEWFNLTDNAGTDAATYTAAVAANNSNVTGSADAEFTISPASVTVRWEVTGEISVGKVMPETATDISSLGLTGKVVEFTAPGITDSAQYSIVVAASGFDAGHSFAAGDEVTLTPSMTFAEGVKAGNYQITYDPETIVKTVTATPVEVKPVNADYSATYGNSVTSAEAFISATYFTIMSGAEGAALTADNFTVTVTNAEGEEQEFGAHGLDAGAYTVTIKGKGAYYVSNDDNRFTYTITPLTLTAGDWSGIDDLTYNGAAAAPVFTPAGVLDGDIVNASVTITGDKVTSGQAVNAGAYTATAESDNVNYKFNGVANVKEFTIAQMVLSGYWEVDSDMDMTYDGTDKSAYVTWKWTTAPLNEGEVTFEITFTGDGEQTAPVGAGNYTATVTFTDSTGNYDTQSGILQGNKYDSMTIKPRPVEITWTAPADLTYSAEAKVPTATISNKVGTDEVTATITYNGNNTDVTAEGFTATVTELTGAAKDNYTLEGGTGITSEKYTITALDVPYEWSFADSAAITYGDGVDKVKALVTLPDGTLLGTEEKVTFEVSVDYSGTTSAGSTVTFTVTAKLPEGVNEANYNITVTAKDGNNTLTVGKAQITFTGNNVTEQKIAGGTLTLTAEQLLAGKYYTIAPAPDFTYSVSGKLSVTRVENSSGQEITADANGYTFTEEGEYTVTYAVSSEESDNYAPAAETFTATLTVSEEAISLTPAWGEYTFTYNGAAQCPVPAFNQIPDDGAIVYTVTVRGDSVLTDGSAVNAGDYTVTLSVAEGFAQKYEFAENATLTFDFTIVRLEAKLSWSEEDATYDGQAHILTATVSNKAAGDDVTVQVELTDGDNTNVTEQGYYFTATGLTGAAAGNYKLPAEVRSGKFYIKPAELTVTTANNSFIYGDKIDLGATVTAIGDDDVSVAIDRVVSGEEPAELKNAGSYTVTYRLEGAAAGNYTIAEGGSSVDVTVKAKELTFTWNSDQTFTYNCEAQAPGYTLNGVVDGDEVTVTVTVKGDNETEGQAINAGVYTASVAEITKGNYSLTGVQTCSFTIGKANLTLTPDSVKFSDRDADKLSAYSKTNYEATIKTNVTVTGVGSDGVFNDFTVTTDASFTGENGTLAVGEYTFTVSVAGGNYNDATYTVTVIEQTVAEFTAKPSSEAYTGGEITFTFANEEGIQLEEGVQITVSGITFNGASAASVLDAGNYTVTFAVTGNSADNSNWYEVSDWTGTISPAVVDVTAVTAVYGDVYTALETGGNLQNGGVWQFVTFKNSPVEVTVTVTDATARAGETYLGAGNYDVTVTLVSGNYTFAGGSSRATSTLQITPKELNIAAQLPEDLTYTSEGIVIGLEDYASQLVGDDEVTVSMLVDGEPYVAGVTVLGAGQHTVTVTMPDTFGNYRLAAAQQTFTVEKKEVTSSITVSGETIENNSSLEIVHGENARVQNAIDNYLTQNGVEKGEYTLTVTDSAGQAADLDNISAWAPGTYTVNLGLSDNFEGGMTFTIVVQEGTTAQIPDAPVLPSTPLEDGGSSGVANWLFPLIIAIECLIAVALIVAIAVSAARRGKNS